MLYFGDTICFLIHITAWDSCGLYLFVSSSPFLFPPLFQPWLISFIITTAIWHIQFSFLSITLQYFSCVHPFFNFLYFFVIFQSISCPICSTCLLWRYLTFCNGRLFYVSFFIVHVHFVSPGITSHILILNFINNSFFFFLAISFLFFFSFSSFIYIFSMTKTHMINTINALSIPWSNTDQNCRRWRMSYFSYYQ